jgi:hypothetical protein
VKCDLDNWCALCDREPRAVTKGVSPLAPRGPARMPRCVLKSSTRSMPSSGTLFPIASSTDRGERRQLTSPRGSVGTR